jgi:hypothetical protein
MAAAANFSVYLVSASADVGSASEVVLPKKKFQPKKMREFTWGVMFSEDF